MARHQRNRLQQYKHAKWPRKRSYGVDSRQLERERQQLEKERQLAALVQQTEQMELRAKLAAIEAESGGSRVSQRSHLSSRRLKNWVNDVTDRNRVPVHNFRDNVATELTHANDELPVQSRPTDTQGVANISEPDMNLPATMSNQPRHE
ncbi:hypothetical protein ACJJTC_010782, partial [Scirpophaga incertulas]